MSYVNLSRAVLVLAAVIAMLILVDLQTVRPRVTYLVASIKKDLGPWIENGIGTTTPTPDSPNAQDLWNSNLSKIPYHPYWISEPERLVEERPPLLDTKPPPRIMYTVKTTVTNHQSRLDILFKTWFTTVAPGDVYLVTDGYDEEYQNRANVDGVNYVATPCNSKDTDLKMVLCCKTGEEMGLAYWEENTHYSWWCHIDDDMYVNHRELVELLSRFDPDVEPVYLGLPMHDWDHPGNLTADQTVYPEAESRRYHFAYGALVCLSRPMLDKLRPWLGSGEKMMTACSKFANLENVVIGATVELVLGGQLSRTNLYSTHHEVLSEAISPDQLTKQIAYSYGCGQSCDNRLTPRNVVEVPNAQFSLDEDPTRFLSIHCLLHPKAALCA